MFLPFQSSTSKELQIPFSNSTADLVCVTCSASKRVSVLVVSTNGALCYWENILSSTNDKIKGRIDLCGNENEICQKVLSLQSHGFVLCTSTGLLYHIKLRGSQLHSAHIKSTQGLLSGIGSRVSSFFSFSQTNTESNVVNFLVEEENENQFRFLVLTVDVLIEWKLVASSDNLLVESSQQINLIEAIKGNFHSKSYIWPLDIKLVTRKKKILVLFAATDSLVEGNIVNFYLYHFAKFSSPSDSQIIAFDYHFLYNDNNLDVELDFNLLIEDPNSRVFSDVAMWSNKRIIFKTVIDGGKQLEEDEAIFDRPDQIMGASHLEGHYIFLSSLNGIIRCTTSSTSLLPASVEESVLHTSLLTSPDQSFQTFGGIADDFTKQIEALELKEDSTSRLHAAFLHFCHRNSEQAKMLIDETFPGNKLDCEELDASVVEVSRNIIDNFPASDPRWRKFNELPNDQISTQAGSLILANQLEDKQSAMETFLTFLCKCGIWDCLSEYKIDGEVVKTRLKLLENAEKIYSIIALWKNHSSYAVVLEPAITRVLEERNCTSQLGILTLKDLFYREISKVDEIFNYLLEEELRILDNKSSTSEDRYGVVMGVCGIFEDVVSSASNRREQKDEKWKDRRCEYHPWTISTKNVDLRKFALQQHSIVLTRGIMEINDSHDRTQMLQILANIITLVLNDYSSQLKSLSHDQSSVRYKEVKSSYEKDRKLLISPLLDLGELKLVAKLAEQHSDFENLIKAVVKMNDKKFLTCLMKKYNQQGFPQIVFNYFSQEKNHRQLLECCEDDSNLNDQLSHFLDSNPRLRWMHQVKQDEFADASETLEALASTETNSLRDKKTFLSLSKLTMQFSEAEPEVIEKTLQEIDQEKLLVKYQETLPASLVADFGIDAKSMPVLSPERLVELYTSESNKLANEVDFKKALELISFLPKQTEDKSFLERDDDFKATIWCRALNRDVWNDINADGDYFVDYSHTIFFKLLSSISDTFERHAPNIDSLLAHEEMNKLSESPLIEHMIRSSFEHLWRSIRKNE